MLPAWAPHVQLTRASLRLMIFGRCDLRAGHTKLISNIIAAILKTMQRRLSFVRHFIDDFNYQFCNNSIMSTWQASFERCFSGRLSIFEEASSRLRQPQWRRLFLQRAVIAYAHIGALDDDDGRSNEAEVSTAAAVTNAPTKDIIDVLNCLQVAQQVQTQSLEGGVLYMCAAGSKLTLALNALKAAALEAISQIGPINQEEDSKVVVKDSREDSADERYTTSVSSFPLPYFDGLNVLGSLGSAAIIRMEKEATNDTSPLHFEATLLPEHATAVLLASTFLLMMKFS